MSMGTPCTGELQFWTVMRSQMTELVKQTTRIANALDKQPEPQVPRVGDMVVWTDPETGEDTAGWRIATVATGGMCGDGVYCIKRKDGSEAEVYLHEIAVYKPAQGGR